MATTTFRSGSHVALTTLFAVLLGQSMLEAQAPNRADLLEAERQGKRDAVTPPERTGIERGMRLIERGLTDFENLTGNDRGLYYSSGHLPAGSGFGFGLGYTYKPTTKGGYSDPGR